MKRYPLQMLITARQIRVDAAQSAVNVARALLDEKISIHAAIVRQREVKQEEYDQQRNHLFEADEDGMTAKLQAQSLMQREHNLALLIDQLEHIDQARFAAHRDVEQAQSELRAAVMLHQRLQAKLDMLLERKKQWRIERQREVDARDEVFAEEIFQARQMKGKHDATTPSRH
jgi:hypothetical protein